LVKNGEVMKKLAYAYSSTVARGTSSGGMSLVPTRVARFYFWNGVLVGHEFASSFADDSTDFDESKIPLVKKGETRHDEAVDLFGRRCGYYIYPMIGKTDARALVYAYTAVKFTPGMKVFNKMLVIPLDENGVVSDVQFSSSGDR